MYPRKRRPLRKLLLMSLLGFLGLSVASIFITYFIVDHHFDKFSKRADVQVKSIPRPVSPESFPAYSGPHPSTINRDYDPFNYPIALGEVGPTEPLYSGPLQYPFYCHTEKSGLGQPLVDNKDGIGIPVYQVNRLGEKTDRVLGYSKDCLIPSQAFYYYNRVGTSLFFPLDQANNDIAKTRVNGREVDFIVRVEAGVINRFIYGIAALMGEDEAIDKPTPDNWNKRLIYQFRGGVGIGFKQGQLRPKRFLQRRFDELKQGYAIAYSTGNQTSNHYNMWVAEELVSRVKNQFTALYGKPLYTLGIGGSGGAIQQLLIAQNHPGLLDGLVALYSYPDMISQTLYAFDCELLEHYFDALAADNDKWASWENRSLIEGLNAKNSFEFTKKPYLALYTTLARAVNAVWPPQPEGSSECVNGWRGLVQLTNNPHFSHFSHYFSKPVLQQTHWSHWENLKMFYGKPENAYANATWDNVGVQYGLEALKNRAITVREFLHLNAHIGGWKPHDLFRQERYWKLVAGVSLFDISPWSRHNMWQGNLLNPARRTEGNVEAIRGAYQSGHVFLGKLDVPMIDLRHYLEDELDMHHLSASFSTRQRMLDTMGQHTNQVIWVAPKGQFPLQQAFEALDRWVLAQQQHPQRDAVATKPADIADQCWDKDHSVLAKGASVWDGDWNSKPEGACLKNYPMYKNSRWIAGDSVVGETFKCQLQSIDSGLAKGLYGDINLRPYRDVLAKIFPNGVCNYQKPGVGKPNLQALVQQPEPGQPNAH